MHGMEKHHTYCTNQISHHKHTDTHTKKHTSVHKNIKTTMFQFRYITDFF